MATAFDYNRYIEELLEQQQQNQGSPYQHLKKTAGDIAKTGKNMTAAGDFMKNNLSNPTLQKLGSNISGVGSKLSSGATKVNNFITPQNYFKGFAPKPFAALGQNAASTGGAALSAPTTQAAGEIAGNVIGSELAGTAAGAGAGAAGSALGAEAAGSAAGGAAAGGAAAGGSAASGAAMSNPVTALVALAAMAAMGANRKRAKKSGQVLLKGLKKEGDAALNQTKEFAQNVNSQIQDYSQPVLGGAAPINPQDVNEQVLNEYMNNNPVQNSAPEQNAQQSQGYLGNLPDLTKAAEQTNNIEENKTAPMTAEASQEEVKRGLMDKFLSGITDLSRGYQENRNNGFDPSNLTADKFKETITNPADTQKITDYQNGLQNDANYNAWAERAGVNKDEAIKAIAEGRNSGNKDVADWIKNNQDAYKETTTEKTYDKGKMARLGEALGTVGRIAQNPAVQGLVAGGLSAALTGNPLYGLGQGYKFANQRAMSNAYRDVLKQYGVDVPETGFFGNIGANDMRNIGNMAETHVWHEYLNQKNADELARKTAKDAADKAYKEGRIQVQQQNAATNAYKAAQKGTNNGGKTGKSSLTGTKNPNYNSALAQYYGILQKGNAGEIAYARKRFMQEIGIDPDTKIKQASKKQGAPSANLSEEEFRKEIGW